MFLGKLKTESERKIFEKLYQENAKRLYYIARKIVRNDADAEDAVHNGFVSLTEKYEKYSNLSYIELVRLCTTIIRNEAYDIARKYQNEGEFMNKDILGEDEIIDGGEDILEELIEKSEQSILRDALMELQADEREMLYHRYVTNLQPREISELLHLSSGEVRKKLFKCKNKLSKVLEKKEKQRR